MSNAGSHRMLIQSPVKITMKTPPKNDHSRCSDIMTYILLALGCGLVLYGTIDFHFFVTRMHAEMEQMTHGYIEEAEEEVESLNTETQRVNAKEK